MRVKAPIVAKGINIRIGNAAFLKKLAARAFKRRFAVLNVTALRFPGVALSVH